MPITNEVLLRSRAGVFGKASKDWGRALVSADRSNQTAISAISRGSLVTRTGGILLIQ